MSIQPPAITTCEGTTTTGDLEKQGGPSACSKTIQLSQPGDAAGKSMFSNLGIINTLLAVWIFLAMAVGILLGNFVPSTGPALEKGQFVGVSVPIGMSTFISSASLADAQIVLCNACFFLLILSKSCWIACHDVPHSVQNQVRVVAPSVFRPQNMETDCV